LTGFCEQVNELSSSVKCGETLLLCEQFWVSQEGLNSAKFCIFKQL